MAKKKLLKQIKLQIPAGKANPAPPIGTALGPTGISIMGFCKEFNAKTQAQVGDILPVVINVYAGGAFTFVTKQPPIPKMILKKLGIEKGSGVPNRDKVGKLTMADVKEIAEKKMPDLRVFSLDAAAKMVMGTARSMGVDVIKE